MSDEQVGELRYIEELEAEVEKLQRSTVHALYQGQKKRAEQAEARVAGLEAEIERLGTTNKKLQGRLAEALRAALDAETWEQEWAWPGMARAALASLEADQSKETV